MEIQTLSNRIVRTPDICGGKPRIQGHRILVRDIVSWFELLRMSADEISYEYDLNLADIYIALAYYHANQKSLQAEWLKEDQQTSSMKEKYPSRLQVLRDRGKA